jgi:hypothetical protein
MKRTITGKPDCDRITRKLWYALLSALLPSLFWALALPPVVAAQAPGTTYFINQTIGNGSVVGRS